MSLIQIPNLPAVIGLAGPELFETVQGGVSYKVSLTQIVDAVWRINIPILPLPVYLGGTGVTTSTGTGSVVLSDSPDFTGQASFADGSAAAPSLTNTGDLNTGLFFPAADTIGFGTGGTERLRVDTSGNVGIGTSTPVTGNSGATLDVSGPIFSRGYLLAHQTNAGVVQYNGNIMTLRAYGVTAGTGAIAFSTGGGGGSADTERMRIDASGNVGIGTTGPAEKLDVVGKGVFTSNADILTLKYASDTGSARLAWKNVAGTTLWDIVGGMVIRQDELAIRRAGTSVMYFDNANNVGIGTTTPTFMLQAALPDATTNKSIGVTETSYTTNFRAAYLTLYGLSATGTTFGISNANLGVFTFQNLSAGLIATNGAAPLVFATTSLERMRIDASGNVGIGTTTPAVKLHVVSSTGGILESLRLQNDSTNATSGRGTQISFRGTSGGLLGTITASTSTTANDQGVLNYSANGATSSHSFTTNSAERMRIDASGNVGIGTSSPTALLSVDGGTYNQTNYAASALIRLQYASGTKAAPTAVSVSSALGIFSGSGNDGAAAYRSTAQMSIHSDGAISPTSAPGFILLSTTPTGTITPVERLRLGSAGQFGIGGANYGTSGQTIISAGSGAAPAWGAVGAAGGGTGITSYTIGDIVYASGTTTLSKLADVATGNALISGGVGVAPSYGKIGLTTHVSGTLPVANGGTGVTTAPAAAAVLLGYTTTATAAGTTVLTNTSTQYQLFTGATTQTITLPVTSTLGTGWSFHIVNNSTGSLTVNSSGGNLVATVIAGLSAMVTCIGTTLTTAADWEAGFTDFQSVTGTGAVVLASSPAITGGSIDNMTVGATTQASVRGTSLVSNSVITDGFITHANGTLALAFATDGVAQVTPNATGTFTTTVPAAGTRCTLIVLTSGVTSFTMTFGTGFKTTGTLATGTVSARYFIFQFISDGTSVIEASRTVAIA